MERNIVLSDELEQLDIFFALGLVAFFREPPAFPVKALFASLLKLVCQLGCNRDISYWSIEPDIENFVLVACLWNRDTPLKVPGYGTLVKPSLEPRLGGVDCVVRPLAIFAHLVHPFFQFAAYGRKIDVEVLGLPYLWCGAAGYALGLLKVDRVQKRTAAVALVAAGIACTALRADSAHIAV